MVFSYLGLFVIFGGWGGRNRTLNINLIAKNEKGLAQGGVDFLSFGSGRTI